MLCQTIVKHQILTATFMEGNITHNSFETPRKEIWEIYPRWNCNEYSRHWRYWMRKSAPSYSIKILMGEISRSWICEEPQHSVQQDNFLNKNQFLLPTGKCGKAYIEETTKCINVWRHDSPLWDIAFLNHYGYARSFCRVTIENVKVKRSSRSIRSKIKTMEIWRIKRIASRKWHHTEFVRRH